MTGEKRVSLSFSPELWERIEISGGREYFSKGSFVKMLTLKGLEAREIALLQMIVLRQQAAANANAQDTIRSGLERQETAHALEGEKDG